MISSLLLEDDILFCMGHAHNPNGLMGYDVEIIYPIMYEINRCKFVETS